MNDPCGCGKHSLGDETAVHMSGKFWNPLCALRDALRRLALSNDKATQAELGHKALLANIGTVQCPYCNTAVGENFEVCQGLIICLNCFNQMAD